MLSLKGDVSAKGMVASLYCSKYSVSLLGMLETKFSTGYEEGVKRSLPYQWKHATNNLIGGMGRIWVMWNPNVFKVVVLRCASQVVTCSVESVDGKLAFVASFVYAENDLTSKVDF